MRMYKHFFTFLGFLVICLPYTPCVDGGGCGKSD